MAVEALPVSAPLAPPGPPAVPKPAAQTSDPKPAPATPEAAVAEAAFAEVVTLTEHKYSSLPPAEVAKCCHVYRHSRHVTTLDSPMQVSNPITIIITLSRCGVVTLLGEFVIRRCLEIVGFHVSEPEILRLVTEICSDRARKQLRQMKHIETLIPLVIDEVLQVVGALSEPNGNSAASLGKSAQQKVLETVWGFLCCDEFAEEVKQWVDLGSEMLVRGLEISDMNQILSKIRRAARISGEPFSAAVAVAEFESLLRRDGSAGTGRFAATAQKRKAAWEDHRKKTAALRAAGSDPLAKRQKADDKTPSANASSWTAVVSSAAASTNSTSSATSAAKETNGKPPAVPVTGSGETPSGAAAINAYGPEGLHRNAEQVRKDRREREERAKREPQRALPARLFFHANVRGPAEAARLFRRCVGSLERDSEFSGHLDVYIPEIVAEIMEYFRLYLEDSIADGTAHLPQEHVGDTNAKADAALREVEKALQEAQTEYERGGDSAEPTGVSERKIEHWSESPVARRLPESFPARPRGPRAERDRFYRTGWKDSWRDRRDRQDRHGIARWDSGRK